MKEFTLITAIVLTANLLFAQIIHIPEDYVTIQDGINAANTGDTVLVAQGTYIENIYFYSKNITIASHYLINPDTSLISQTIIDGNQNGRVVTMDAGILNGFTITNGYAEYVNGGGIYCSDSAIRLSNLIICNNTTPFASPIGGGGGGGICISSIASLTLEHVVIANNIAEYGGGGVYCWDSNPLLQDVVIENNTAESIGGGIYCSNSNPVLQDVIIENNSAIGAGGAPTGGVGGGTYFFHSDPIMKNVTIRNNVAKSKAGGVFFSNSQPVFDSIERCNIYMNHTFEDGNDLYSENPVEIILDTFTVINPTSVFATPISNFTFNILNGLITQVYADLYVSPTGDNSNSGLTAGEPLKNIQYAFLKILADSLNPHTIFLLEGTYSTTSNDEWFPVHFPDYVSLAGTSQNDVILDAEQNSRVIRLTNNKGTAISNLTITGGYTVSYPESFTEDGGGGIYCDSSNVLLQNLSIIDNSAVAYDELSYPAYGGGLCFRNSEPLLQNLTVSNNSASYGGGIYYSESTPVFTGGAITNNSSTKYGGGIYLYDSNVIFDSINRCSIYLNHSLLGKDLYSYQYVEVFVDTFTVLNPTTYFIQPFANFSMDVLHGLIPQISADVYVAPDGDNNNSGLTSGDPFKTIDHALSVILSTETDPHIIHLLSGTYAPSTNGEMYPLVIPEYSFIEGVSESSVILDAEDLSGVLEFHDCQYAEISNMTITGGYKSMYIGGAGMRILNSNPLIHDVTISGNSCLQVVSGGGGVLCGVNSSPVFKNTTINDNTTSNYGGGGMACYGGAPKFENTIVSNNSSTGLSGGGGIYFSNSNPVLINCIFFENTTSSSGGAISCRNSNPTLVNISLSDNVASEYYGGGGICCRYNSNPVLFNTILWNNEPNEISYYYIGDPNSITISLSDIQEGEAGIVTNGNGTINWLEGNIDEDPLFVGTGDHPYSLTNESPCVNTGTPDTTGLNLPELDLAGNPRFFGGRIEMGSYENQEVIVGVKDDELVDFENELQIFPNPARNEVSISVKDGVIIKEVNIYNQIGQRLIHKKGKINSVNISILPKGMCIFEIETENGKYRRKLIIE